MTSTVFITAACLSLLAGSSLSMAQNAPAAAPAPAKGAKPGQSVSLTIYSSARPGAVPPELYSPGMSPQDLFGVSWQRHIPGYAVVRDMRPVTLSAGRSTVRFTDVAALIDPTTVQFTSLTDPENTRVVEQDFQFDLVSSTKLLEKYIDRQITVERTIGDRISAVTGTLLSTGSRGGGLVIRDESGKIQTINSYQNIIFPELPGGLITRPTLVWDIFTNTPGEHSTRVSYQTTGITWWADYNIVFAAGKDANSGLLDIGAWVSILNQSGATYPEASLKLIAGDVNRARPEGGVHRDQIMRMESAAAAAPKGFEQKEFFEYHLYTLGRPTSIPNNSTKQIELFDQARGVPAEKIIVYAGAEGVFGGFYGSPIMGGDFGNTGNTKLDIYLQFKNDKPSGLGIPIPAGRVRVSQLDPADGSMEFIGEDVVDHTPQGENVRIKLGRAFDIVGERVQIAYRHDEARRTIEEAFTIKIRNRKKDLPVNVIVQEDLYRWSNWEITQKSHEFTKVNASRIHFPITVAPDGETVVTYRVKYTW